MLNLSTLKLMPHKGKNILFLHFIICSIGLLKLSMAGVSDFYQTYLTELSVAKLGNLGIELSTGKYLRYLQYVFGSIIILGVYWTGYKILQENDFSLKSSVLLKPVVLCCYFIVNVIFNIKLFNSGSTLSHWLMIWLILAAALPIIAFKWHWQDFPTLKRPAAILLINLLSAQLAWIFIPLILKPMLIENDYIGIPGQTRLASGQWVDNLQYINQHHIGGIVAYDPRINPGQTPLPIANATVKIVATGSLANFLAANVDDANYRYTYYPATQQLALTGLMTETEHRTLRYAFTTEHDRQQIDKLYFQSLAKQSYYKQRVYTAEEWDFIHKNKMELVDQEREGWFFYHHNYMISPVVAIVNGASPDHYFEFYGRGSTSLFAKLLPYLGGVNYQTYFKLSYSIYLLYYLFFIAAIFFLFKRTEYVILSLLFLLCSLFYIKIISIKMAPGFNPLRHFFDILAFVFFYCYVLRGKIGWIMASFSFAIIAIFLNSQFGIFLLASIVAATILYSWLNGRRFSLEMMISGLFAVGGTLLYFTLQEHNPAAVYLLLGFGSLPVRKAVLANMLLINAAIYLCMLLFGKIKDALYYTLWLAVFYCQALLIYYIYYPMAHHIFSLATPFILLILMMIYVGMRRFKLVSLEKPLLTMGILTAFVFAYVPMAFSFYHDYNIYQANFKDHRLYQWRFPSAQFLSTMDPSMFEQAVKLIRQYNPSDRLYMISRYDTLLPALAGKYSAMRYPDLISNLVTKNEVTDLASLILQNKPKYLFIDSDLNRSFNNEVYNPNDPVTVYFEMYNNSIIHAKALRQLGLLFAEIANDYQPVARSPLITVYQRKDL